MNEIGFFRTLINPIKNRVFNMLARAIVDQIDDTKKIQLIKATILKDETHDGIEHLQNYGFTSVAKSGAEALCGFISGNRDHGIAIIIDDRRFRLKGLASGEVALYTDEGDKIIFRRGRNVEIVAGTQLTITTPDLNVTGNISAGGEVSDGTRSMSADRSIYNSHTHQDILGNPDPLEPPTPQQ